MPTAKVAADLEMFYRVDDFADPWRAHDTVLMLHGNAESSAAWFAWVPTVAREYRVVRPDMRGFGDSTPMARDYRWSLDRVLDDFIGGTIALRFAARHPDRVSTLTVVGSPASGQDALGTRIDSWLEHLERNGVESWARWTMPGRLGSKFPAEGAEWWAQMMGRTPLTTQLGFVEVVPSVDVRPDLPSIACPTLVITTEGSGLGSVDAIRSWTEKIPRAELLVLPGDSYHVAATDPERCAQATLDFLRRAEKRK
jgi:3-oxoadipate enol-lactonase